VGTDREAFEVKVMVLEDAGCGVGFNLSNDVVEFKM
jgi:hypothetical protein